MKSAERTAILRQFVGDPTIANRNRVIEANLGLVHLVIKRFYSARRGDADYIQEGVIGLCQALNELDPSRLDAFPSFAIWKIRGALSLLRGREMSARHCSRITAESRRRGHRHKTIVFSFDDMAKRQIKHNLTAEDGYQSLDEVLPDGSLLVDEVVSRKEIMEKVSAMTMSEMEREIFNRSFHADEDMASLGKKYGLTRQRVSQIRQQLLKRCREELTHGS